MTDTQINYGNPFDAYPPIDLGLNHGGNPNWSTPSPSTDAGQNTLDLINSVISSGPGVNGASRSTTATSRDAGQRTLDLIREVQQSSDNPFDAYPPIDLNAKGASVTSPSICLRGIRLLKPSARGRPKLTIRCFEHRSRRPGRPVRLKANRR
jgi:hypothetical protein